MCRFVYIIAEQPLRLPNPSRWLRVVPCDEVPAERVRAVVPGQFVYLASSWQSCGCGFSYDANAQFVAGLAEIPEDEPARIAVTEFQENGQTSVDELRQFLERCVRIVGRVRLYVAWAGEEGRQPESEEMVAPSYFGGDGFSFCDPELFTIDASDAITVDLSQDSGRGR